MKKPLSIIILLIFVAIFVSAKWDETAASTQTAKGKGGGVAAAYKQHCAKCHNDDGKGLESLEPPDFTDAKWQGENTDKMIAEGIRNGKGVMPGFKDVLTPAQVTSMVKYVRAFSPKPAKNVKKKNA
ncbi:MAG: c-type cytochrome [Acidobacteria bacterium]|nr:c-type cytochrome [Acidobacteriota bacterium]